MKKGGANWRPNSKEILSEKRSPSSYNHFVAGSKEALSQLPFEQLRPNVVSTRVKSLFVCTIFRCMLKS